MKIKLMLNSKMGFILRNKQGKNENISFAAIINFCNYFIVRLKIREGKHKEDEMDNYTAEEKKLLLKLARDEINYNLTGENPPLLVDLDEKLMQVRSCFVTLHTASGALRGCIGNIEPYQPLAENIIHNAKNSAFGDPRFPPVSADEVDSLVIEISILTVPEPVPSYKDFVVGKHGIILSKGGRSAVFLPQVAPEQGWDAETTLTHLAMKAGLFPEAWKDEDCQFRTFEAIYFSEKNH